MTTSKGLTSSVHGDEVRIYFDGELIGTAEHTIEYGGKHKLVASGVAVRKINHRFRDVDYRSAFPASGVNTYAEDDQRLTEAGS